MLDPSREKTLLRTKLQNLLILNWIFAGANYLPNYRHRTQYSSRLVHGLVIPILTIKNLCEILRSRSCEKQAAFMCGNVSPEKIDTAGYIEIGSRHRDRSVMNKQ